ncbi:MAG: TMEM175 family protein [Paraglaciecola sp.]|uniref:TMEM175 family protein n=1 Tax=Paraglaciecola sp. TaxID=1920173 RepID=UPI0032980087
MLNKPNASPFKMRGDNMTRIETFVAAAFAFAVTMLVISVGAVPETMQDFVDATKQIPAFCASCALIMWIWHSHAVWCRRIWVRRWNDNIFEFRFNYTSVDLYLSSKIDDASIV